MSDQKSQWIRHFILAALVVVLIHGLTIWALPRLIMDRIITGGSADLTLERAGGVILPPPTDHNQRRIVMPSPDLLYAVCFFDLSDTPFRVTLETDYPRYWSIALYASTSDNFFVVSDKNVAGGKVDLTVVRSRQAESQVVSPTRRGMLLMRLLINSDPEVRKKAEMARRSLRCGPNFETQDVLFGT
ncbi:MAG: DUF1254 domain-containing protein [Gammaproteobacteria bacterium]|nr:DUF1254 domain-containing protein [Gammaproteobacteria bacterium]